MDGGESGVKQKRGVMGGEEMQYGGREMREKY